MSVPTPSGSSGPPSTAMRELIDRMRTAVPLETFSVDVHRERVTRAEALVPTDPTAVIGLVETDGRRGMRIARSRDRAEQVVMLFHHGAFVAGSPRSLLAVGAELARQSGAEVVAPEYPLAPEYPFPAAIEHALGWYQALLAGGWQPHEIVIGGASAGGGIAAGALVAIRDRGLPPPAGSLLHCPFVDLTLSSPAQRADDVGEPIDSSAIVHQAAGLYLDGADPAHPWASPAYADLAGLPPLHIEAAGADRLVDDARRLHERAVAAGVRSELHVAEGAIHNFAQYAPELPESNDALDRMATAVRGWR